MRNINLEAIEPANERELQVMMRQWRHGRAQTNIGKALSDGYVAVFGLTVLLAMVIAGVLDVNRNASSCDTVACQSSRMLLPMALVAVAMTVAFVLARLFGPVLASAAEGFWLFDAPIRRTRILSKRLLTVIALAFIVAAPLGGLIATLLGLNLTSIAVWTLAAGLAPAAVMAFAAAEQGREREIWVKIGQALSSVISLGGLVAVVSVAVGWWHLPAHPERALVIGYVVCGVSLAIIVAAAVIAARRLNNIRRRGLTSGGALVSGMQGAMFALDFGLMRDILVEREAVQKGRVNPVRGRGNGLYALIWRDAHRLWRNPKPLIGLAVAAMLPYAFAALGLHLMNVTLSALALCAVLVPTMLSMRVLARTPGMARMLPYSTSQLRTATMAVPTVLALIWAAIVTPTFMGFGSDAQPLPMDRAALLALVAAVAGLLGAVRWVTAGQVNYNAPMLATASGALPTNLIFNLFRGIDVVAIVTIPLLIKASPFLCLGIAGFVFLLLRGTFNMEELQNAKERQDALAARELEKAKAAKKKKITRPTR